MKGRSGVALTKFSSSSLVVAYAQLGGPCGYLCRGVRAVAGGEKGRGWWAPLLDVYMLQVVNNWLCPQPQQQRLAITAERRAPIPEHPGS
jgi:hypothetical protein